MDGDRTHLRDVSFSSYLSMVGENFSVDQAPTPPPPVPARGLETPRRAKTSEELGVFEAERYYNTGVVGYDKEENINESKLGYQVMTQTPNKRNKHNNFRTTPSVSSEGSSSWNSQSALMLAYAKRSKKASTNSFFSGIGCYGRSCSDKDSVIVQKPVRKSEVCQIDPKLIVFDGTKQSLPRFHHHPKDEPLVLRSPVSIASSSNMSESISRRVLAPALNRIIKDEDVPRVSLEVFGSNKVKKPADNHDGDHDRVLLNIERKLSMLTWDAVPKSQSMTKSGGHDEIESDASSDLFEIENISSQNEQRYGGGGGCETPASAYEPSEASIEWSVVTASAADFSGNGMEYDEKRVSETTPRKGGGILGCKSYKAVRVVEPLPAPKSSYRATLPAAVVGLTSHGHHLRHNQSQVQ